MNSNPLIISNILNLKLEANGEAVSIYSWLVVSTSFKNMLVKLDHFPKYQGEHKKYLSCHHLDSIHDSNLSPEILNLQEILHLSNHLFRAFKFDAGLWTPRSTGAPGGFFFQVLQKIATQVPTTRVKVIKTWWFQVQIWLFFFFRSWMTWGWVESNFQL